MADFVRCNGELRTEGVYPQCSGYWEAVQIQPPFDPSQLDPASLGTAFTVGFGLVALFMGLSMGLRALLNFIKNC